MDVFYEYLVTREKTKKDKMMSAVYITAAVIISLFSMFILGLYLNGFEFIFIAGAWYGAVQLMCRSDIEYEYVLTNSVLDIDRITAKKKRKRMISIDFKNIEKCEPKPYGTEMIKVMANEEVMNLTGNPADKNIYFVDFCKGSGRYRVYFQPDDVLMEHLKNANPRYVKLKEESEK